MKFPSVIFDLFFSDTLIYIDLRFCSEESYKIGEWLNFRSYCFPGTGLSSSTIMMSLPNPNTPRGNLSYTSPWLTSDASKHRLDVTDVLPGNTMPVNTMDIENKTLLCGTDGEQIYTIKNLAIR